MKTIGLIGGMSWESTATYYKLINEGVKNRLGGLHSAKLILWSFDFNEIAALQSSGNWAAATAKMVQAGRALKQAGAEALVICTNTMHKLAPELEVQAGLPVLHIADSAAQAIKAAAISKVGLLATRFTMEHDFYRDYLRINHGVEVIVPDDSGRTIVHDVIYNELCQGVVRPESKQQYQEIMASLYARGAQGIVLGCTEIGMLISPADTDLPIFDTTPLHAQYALKYIFGEEPAHELYPVARSA